MARPGTGVPAAVSTTSNSVLQLLAFHNLDVLLFLFRFLGLYLLVRVERTLASCGLIKQTYLIPMTEMWTWLCKTHPHFWADKVWDSTPFHQEEKLTWLFLNYYYLFFRKCGKERFYSWLHCSALSCCVSLNTSLHCAVFFSVNFSPSLSSSSFSSSCSSSLCLSLSLPHPHPLPLPLLFFFFFLFLILFLFRFRSFFFASSCSFSASHLSALAVIMRVDQ